MNNNNQPPLSQMVPPLPLLESLEYHDMVGMVKPTIHVDEFASKMGDDDEIIVVSFYVRNQQAARDLINWFEKGYDWVLDAEMSPGEIKPGRWLVYVELRRRSSAGEWIQQMLDDLTTLTEHSGHRWNMTYEGREVPFSRQAFDGMVPLSPKEYRERREGDLNEMRVAAGLETRRIYERDRYIRNIQAAAGIY